MQTKVSFYNEIHLFTLYYMFNPPILGLLFVLLQQKKLFVLTYK